VLDVFAGDAPPAGELLGWEPVFLDREPDGSVGDLQQAGGLGGAHPPQEWRRFRWWCGGASGRGSTPHQGEPVHVGQDGVDLGISAPGVCAHPPKIEPGLKPRGDPAGDHDGRATKSDDVPPGRFEVAHVDQPNWDIRTSHRAQTPPSRAGSAGFEQNTHRVGPCGAGCSRGSRGGLSFLSAGLRSAVTVGQPFGRLDPMTPLRIALLARPRRTSSLARASQLTAASVCSRSGRLVVRLRL